MRRGARRARIPPESGGVRGSTGDPPQVQPQLMLTLARNRVKEKDYEFRVPPPRAWHRALPLLGAGIPLLFLANGRGDAQEWRPPVTMVSHLHLQVEVLGVTGGRSVHLTDGA